MRFLFVVLALVSLCLMVVIECEGLRCYSCSYTSANDHLCLNDPYSVFGGIMECNRKYCRITRQELQNPSGTVLSFLRDCQEEYMDQISEDDTFKTFYRSCSTDLCNSGSGIGSENPYNPDNPGENLIIDGLNPNGSGGVLRSEFSILLTVIGGLAVAALNSR